MLFSLKFQRSNQQSTLTIDSTKGKTGEKGCILQCCGDETTTYYDTVSLERQGSSSLLFYLKFKEIIRSRLGLRQRENWKKPAFSYCEDGTITPHDIIFLFPVAIMNFCRAASPPVEKFRRVRGGGLGEGCRLTLGLIFRENREFMGIKGK